MKVIGKIIELAILEIKSDLQYVGSFWGLVLSNFLQIVILYFLWMAIYGENTVMYGMSKTQMISYIILARMLASLFTYGVNLMISHMILDGSISMQLLRPMDFQLTLYSGRLGSFFVQNLIVGIPILFIASLFFGLSLPYSPLMFILFLISCFMAITISFLVEFFAGVLTFYTTNGWGIQILKAFVISFFSGALIPLSFYQKSPPSFLLSIKFLTIL